MLEWEGSHRCVDVVGCVTQALQKIKGVQRCILQDLKETDQEEPSVVFECRVQVDGILYVPSYGRGALWRDKSVRGRSLLA